VPDEYDVLCEGCGYSLVGIQSDRCPECGKVFEPNQLPFARVPWLHRRKIGSVKAFFSTCRMVLQRPRLFAEELCRPVRISAADARAFRKASIRVATLAAALIALQLAVVFAYQVYGDYRRYPRLGTRYFVLESVAFVAGSITIVLVINLFFRLLTDLPVFIWKGHPLMKPMELAPVHCYAAAPLVLLLGLPVLVLINMLLVAFWVLDPLYAGVIAIIYAVAVVWWLYILLSTTVRLMIGTGVERRRVRMMILYMPVHLLMMGFVCAGSGFVLIGLENIAIKRISTGHF